MSKGKKLNKLVNLATEFTRAVDNQEWGNSPLVEKLGIHIEKNPRIGTDMTARFEGLETEWPELMASLNMHKPVEDIPVEFSRRYLETLNAMAQHFLDAGAKKEARAILPGSIRSAKNSAAFSEAKAPALAKLFAPK